MPDLSTPYRAHVPNYYLYQRNASVLVPYEQKTASGASSPLTSLAQTLPQHLVLSMSEKII